MFDIVFISYQEENAEENWSNLKCRFPAAKRVHGIKGIHSAHKHAANMAFTKMFWVVDGDAEVLPDFNFDIDVSADNYDAVHVCRSINPINGLIYGNGGVKLLPTKLVKEVDVSSTDMTTSISKKFIVIDQVSNITKFNTSSFNTWRSAFRECAKLSSKVIDRQNDNETNYRLHTWCTVGADKEYGKYAIAGANDGKKFGLNFKNDLSKINDFQWLKEKFNDSQQ